MSGTSSPPALTATGIAIAAIATTLAAGAWFCARELERVAVAMESYERSVERLAQGVEAMRIAPAATSATGGSAAAGGDIIGASPMGEGRLLLADRDGRLLIVGAQSGESGLAVEHVYRIEVDEFAPGPRHGVKLIDVAVRREATIMRASAELDRLSPDSMEAAKNGARIEQLAAEIGEARGFDVLLAELRHERAPRRRAAALALGEHGFRVAAGPLIEQLGLARDDEVRARLQRLLARLSGLAAKESGDESLAAWQQWWERSESEIAPWERAE